MTKVISEAAAKAKAKALRIALQEAGITIAHQKALEVVSKIEGQQDWSTFNAKQASVVPKSSAPAGDTRTPDSAPAPDIYDFDYGVLYFCPGSAQWFSVDPYQWVSMAAARASFLADSDNPGVTAKVGYRNAQGGWTVMGADELAKAIQWDATHCERQGPSK